MSTHVAVSRRADRPEVSSLKPQAFLPNPKSGDKSHLWVRNPKSGCLKPQASWLVALLPRCLLLLLPCCLLALASAPSAFADPPVVTGFEVTGGVRWPYQLPAIIPTGPYPEMPAPEPAHVFACGSRWVRVFGDNFDLGYPDLGQGAVMRLFMAGAADIEVVPHDGGWITMNPDFEDYYVAAVEAEIFVPEGQPSGLYSLEVTNASGESGVLADVLMVDGSCLRGRAGDLYVANKLGRDEDAGVMLQTGATASQDCPFFGGCEPAWFNMSGNILQFDGQTGEFVCVFARSDALHGAYGLVWGPNGNLFVLSTDNPSSGLAGLGKVIEFDGRTGEEVRILTYSAAGHSSFWPKSLDFGGPDGNLFLLHCDDWVREYDRVSGAFLRKLVNVSAWSPNGESFAANYAEALRFGPNGNLLVCGTAYTENQAALNEFDPVSGDLVRTLIVGPLGLGSYHFKGMLYEAGTDTLLMVEAESLSRFDFATGANLETVIRHPGNGPAGTLDKAIDLQYGPTGNLFVVAEVSRSPFYSEYIPGSPRTGAIHEFDSGSFDQVQFFGSAHYGEIEWARKPRPTELYNLYGIAFKPYPGDWGGKMAGGDWQVDAWDYDRFVEAFNNTSNNRANDLLAFDFDHDGDIDCDDWAEFQLAWTAGGSPPVFPECVGYTGDDDGDGVHNDDDLCPETTPGTAVSATGCPLGDLDNDNDVDLADLAALLANYGKSWFE